MEKIKRDLLIHFDERGKAIVCYSIDEASSLKLREKEFPLAVPLATYIEAGADEAEKMMGAGIFALLELHSKSKIGLRNYANEAIRERDINFDEIEAKAKKGDPECQYFLALELFHIGVRNRDRKNIELAGDWLKKSAEANHPAAVDYLKNHWERDKESALRGMSPD